MIKAIIFDWGGVLIDNPVNDLVTFFAHALDVSNSDIKAAYSLYQFPFYKGLISEDEFSESLCKSLKIPKPNLTSLWKEAVRSVFKEKNEVFDLIVQLRSEGYKTAILSNTEMPTVEHYYEMQYEQYFDEAIFSCHENMAKPDAEIYHLTLNRLKIQPDEALLIDDRLENIEGAKRVGMQGILFKDSDQMKHELNKYLL